MPAPNMSVTAPSAVADPSPASAFSTRPSSVSVTDFNSVFTLYGTREAPLFPIDQVHSFLDTDIRGTIRDFDSDEVDPQQMFLTEAGMERLLFAGHYAVAIAFK